MSPAPPPQQPVPGERWGPWRLAFFVLLSGLAMSPALIGGALHRYSNRYDWRYFEALGELSRRTVLWFHQVPLWNPASCGGEVALANPQSLDAAPTFLLVLLLGTTEGYKLALVLYLFLALDGTFRLARHLGASEAGATLAAIGYGLCGYLGMHYSTGHFTFTGVSLFPYLLLCYDRCLSRIEWCVPAGLCAAWIVLLGGTFTPPMAAELLLCWALLRAISARSAAPLVRLVPCALVALLCGAVRMFPVLEFIHDHPRPTFMRATDSAPPQRVLWDLIAWYDDGALPGRKYWAHEYGAHLPLPVLPLALLGIAASLQTAWRRFRAAPALLTDEQRLVGRWLLAMAAVAFVLSMGNFTAHVPGTRWQVIAPWTALQKLPVLRDLRVPSRHMVVVALAAALLAGLGWDALARRLSLGQAAPPWLAPTLILWAALDGTIYSARLFRGGNFTDVLVIPRPPVRFYHEPGGWQYMREVFFRGHGSLGCDEEAPLQRAKQPLEPDAVPQERLADPSAGTILASRFSPNVREVDVDLRGPTQLLINSNWNEHWRAAPDGVALISVAGRLGADLSRLPPGRHTVVLRYAPRSFYVGLVVTCVSLPLCCAAFLLAQRRRRQRGPR